MLIEQHTLAHLFDDGVALRFADKGRCKVDGGSRTFTGNDVAVGLDHTAGYRSTVQHLFKTGVAGSGAVFENTVYTQYKWCGADGGYGLVGSGMSFQCLDEGGASTQIL